METKVIGARLTEGTILRLKAVAEADHRSVASAIAVLIERGLPAWEAELAAKVSPASPLLEPANPGLRKSRGRGEKP